jgi:hypothetical protein
VGALHFADGKDWPMRNSGSDVRGDPSNAWLGEGEKYAMLGLNLKSDRAGFTDEELSADLTVLTQSAFKMPSHWREWLGSMRAEEVEECDLFVVEGEVQASRRAGWREPGTSGKGVGILPRASAGKQIFTGAHAGHPDGRTRRERDWRTANPGH